MGVQSTGTITSSNGQTVELEYTAGGRDIERIVIETSGSLVFTFTHGDIVIRRLQNNRKEAGWKPVGANFTATDGLRVNGTKELSKGLLKPLVRRARGFRVLVANSAGVDVDWTIDVYESGGPGDEDLAPVSGRKA